MPRIGNCECVIETDEGPIQEYNDPDLEPIASSENGILTVTRYIKATDDQSFSIKFTVHDGTGILPMADIISLWVVIDGTPLDNVFKATKTLKTFPQQRIVNGTEYKNSDGTWVKKKLFFSKLEISDDDATYELPLDKAKLAELGEIKVAVCRALRRQQNKPRLDESLGNVNSSNVVNEKVLKGRDVSHTVNFGTPAACNDVIHWHAQYFDVKEEPWRLFRFLYRSERVLRNMGAIPWTNSSSEVQKPKAGSDNMPPATKKNKAIKNKADHIKLPQAITGSSALKHKHADSDSDKPLKKIKSELGREARY